MLISIIMPIYNSARTLGRAIESVINQTDKSYELIIIDAGSIDGTRDIIERYKKQITYFISEPDKGYADALNKGLAVSNGEYWMMLAADDIFFPNAIEKIRTTIKKGTDIWCGSVIEEVDYGYRMNISDKNLELMYKQCSLRHPASAFKRELYIKNGGYDIRYKCAADREIFLRYYVAGANIQVENIPIVLFAMGGLSTKNPEEYGLPEDIQISRKYGMSEEEISEYLANYRSAREVYLKKMTLLRFLSKTGLLVVINKITGKPKNFMTKKKVVELGMSPNMLEDLKS